MQDLTIENRDSQVRESQDNLQDVIDSHLSSQALERLGSALRDIHQEINLLRDKMQATTKVK